MIKLYHQIGLLKTDILIRHYQYKELQDKYEKLLKQYNQTQKQLEACKIGLNAVCYAMVEAERIIEVKINLRIHNIL
jgi:hypothetical protein